MPELKFFLSGIIILNLLLKIDNIMDNGLKIENNYYELFYLQMCLHMKVLIKKQLFNYGNMKYSNDALEVSLTGLKQETIEKIAREIEEIISSSNHENNFG